MPLIKLVKKIIHLRSKVLEYKRTNVFYISFE